MAVSSARRSTPDPLSARGYLWDDGRFTFITVPGSAFAGAEEINERGQIAGSYADALDAPNRGYLLERGRRFTTFAAPGGAFTQVFGPNNRKEIVGYTADSDLP